MKLSGVFWDHALCTQPNSTSSRERPTVHQIASDLRKPLNRWAWGQGVHCPWQEMSKPLRFFSVALHGLVPLLYVLGLDGLGRDPEPFQDGGHNLFARSFVGLREEPTARLQAGAHPCLSSFGHHAPNPLTPEVVNEEVAPLKALRQVCDDFRVGADVDLGALDELAHHVLEALRPRVTDELFPLLSRRDELRCGQDVDERVFETVGSVDGQAKGGVDGLLVCAVVVPVIRLRLLPPGRLIASPSPSMCPVWGRCVPTHSGLRAPGPDPWSDREELRTGPCSGFLRAGVWAFAQRVSCSWKGSFTEGMDWVTKWRAGDTCTFEGATTATPHRG